MMNKKTGFPLGRPNQNKGKARRSAGFTLTEVLLAVMIVGLVGVALAALTTAASRESGVGRSKIMLRNNLSLALRTLRADLATAAKITFIKGPLDNSSSGDLLRLSFNIDESGEVAQGEGLSPTKTKTNLSAGYVVYCFVPGNITSNIDGQTIQPAGATIGGRIYRATGASPSLWCGSSSALWLDNVKYIPSTNEYPVPLFCKGSTCGESGGNFSDSLLSVRIITELNSSPITNDAVEEIFVAPNGF